MIRSYLTVLIACISFSLAGCNDADNYDSDFTESPMFDSIESFQFESRSMGDEEREFIESSLSDANTADDAYFMMIKDIGGEDRYQELLDNVDEKSLIELHRNYDFEYEVRDTSASDFQGRAITDCTYLFPGRDRNKSIRINDNVVRIDAVGRPFRSSVRKTIGRSLFIHPRNRTCQSTVASYGISGDQGGHLVGSSIGGYNKRANLVPQNGNFNQGVWNNLVERSVKKCFDDGGGVVIQDYRVTASYTSSSGSNVRPSYITVSLKFSRIGFPFRPPSLTRSFSNSSTSQSPSNLTNGRRFAAFAARYC